MTRKISIFLGILFFLLLGSSIILASEELTLEESITIALEKSLSIYIAQEEIKAKEFEELSTKADFLPKLSASYTYTRLDNDTINDVLYRTSDGTIKVEECMSMYQTFLAHKAARF